ncbi:MULTISPECIES: phospholipase [unclassified Bradyrhizobium]|uniref:carboxylesterase family protein n=1 Tax=unclassified Bradyrhizobium TaxID=2631580 RepID=UPI0028EDAEED|nr:MULTISPECIES: phospholipase [unclassified Bradyrhizobium]
MTDAVVDDILIVLPPLLQTLEALSHVARYLNPPDFDRVMADVGDPERTLHTARIHLTSWPADFAHIRIAFDTAADAALMSFAGLRAVQRGEGDLVDVFRALRQLPRALEALFPLAATLPPLSEFFLDPAVDGDNGLRQLLAASSAGKDAVFHDHNEIGNRGGFSLYVPEYYTADRAWPLVMALHGGSGNGRDFLWSWLRAARSLGAILVAPTAAGPTWALMGDDADTPNLLRILDLVRSRVAIDPARMLLTGMSDGGTFCYVSGLAAGSPFTHLAPVAATFHPLMAEIADRDRLRGLPIQIVHGRLDWMFPVEIARHTADALAKAGANVAYREIDDLSHCYPREANVELLRWLLR